MGLGLRWLARWLGLRWRGYRGVGCCGSGYRGLGRGRPVRDRRLLGPLTTTIRSRLIRPITITLIRRLPITTMAWVPAAAATKPGLAPAGIESLVVSGSVGRAAPRSTAAWRMPSHYLALTQSRCRRRRNRHRRRQNPRRHPNLVADRRQRRPRSADPIRRRDRCR